MSVPYAPLLRNPSTLRMLVTGLVGRFPLAVVSMGTVLLIESETGSFALAGLASSVVLCAGGVSGPIAGTLADRLGQRVVLIVVGIAHLLAVAALLLAAFQRATPVVILICAALAGATVLPIASFMRARWSRLLATDEIQAAFALEAIFDELVWIGGPAIAAFLSVTVNPGAGLVVGAVVGAVGAFTLAGIRHGAHNTSAGDVARRARGIGPMLRVMRNKAVLAGFAAAVIVGVSFGFSDLSAVALSRDDGVPEMAGVILSFFSIGSVTGGFLFGLVRTGWNAKATLAFTSLLLPVCYSLTAIAPNTWWMLGAGLFAGLSISPFNIALNRVVQELAPPEIVTQALAWTTTAFLVGMAIGNWLGGIVLQSFGARAGYITSALLLVVPLVITLLLVGDGWRSLLRSFRTAVRS